MYKHGFVLGAINGMIPCGLVYIALAGAILEKSIYSSMLFMLMFGIGTLPMMLMVILGGGFLNQKSKGLFRKVTPYLQLAMGVWFLYRGILIDYPMDIDFYLSLKEGPLCH
jgi:sulfite exporter TauE/SafE